MKTIPHIRGLPLLGVALDYGKDRTGFVRHAAEKHGDVVSYDFAIYRVYQVNHPALIHEILVAKVDKFTKSRLDHLILGPYLGQGLLLSEGEHHMRQRRLMQPVFQHKRIMGYGEVMVDLTLKLVEGWRDGQNIDLHAAMSDLTRHIVLATLFGSGADLGDLAEVLETLNEVGGAQYGRGFPFPKWLPIAENRRQQEAVRRLDAGLTRIIDDRRRSGEDRGDLLSMLLQAQDEENGTGMSDRQVRDEAVTLFAAGHETTANAMAWTFYLLSQSPRVEARLHAEVDAVLADRRPTVEDLSKLRYTEMIIKESLRLYPPAWTLMGRAAKEDVEIGDGYVIPKGAAAYIIPYVMHHDPRFFTDPDAFQPERWTPEFEKALPRYAYFPFGGGPHVCIGNGFAMMETKLVLATIARHARADLQPGAHIAMNPLVTLRPKEGVPVVIRRRHLKREN